MPATQFVPHALYYRLLLCAQRAAGVLKNVWRFVSRDNRVGCLTRFFREHCENVKFAEMITTRNFKVKGKRYTFDSFECAIHALVLTDAHCGYKTSGYSVEGKGKYFCCTHCAKEAGVRGVDDGV